jgi:hypothetical protein
VDVVSAAALLTRASYGLPDRLLSNMGGNAWRLLSDEVKADEILAYFAKAQSLH